MRNGILPNVVLRTIELTKRFGRHVAVDHLDLEVYEGDVFGFLGPNGAGKTTTMRMMVGLVKPTGGQIEINGCDVRRNFLDAIAQVGAMVDTPAFYLGLSGRKNLAISARMCGGVRRRRIREVLGIVGMADVARRKVKTYSHGMRQRLAIAQALLTRPQLLILDEPTLGLDPEGKFDLLDLLRRLAREEKITIFTSSHLLEEVEEVCNRAAIIKEGRLLLCGEVRTLLAEELRTYLLLASDPHQARALLDAQAWVHKTVAEDDRLLVTLRQEDAPRVPQLLVPSGIHVSELSPRLKNLRQLFIEVVQEQGDAPAKRVAARGQGAPDDALDGGTR